ncbi:MAG: flagellar protein FlgN [Micavibrio aeruginosavorus]|uniref:Flagellar protein FlgN n=1 Tax=Micavibrio aeruginosavorus TaxID=349221 RepID=A0A7T5R1S9_9BACT|nr:MAG: flagellar protein FlgN [Micavibrio aeruginosavorus]
MTDSVNSTPHPAILLDKDPNKAIQQMMDALDALRAVYDEENKALQSADTRRFMDLQERKIDAAQRYHDTAAQIIENREKFSKADPVLRQKLQAMHSDFSKMTEVNLTALERLNKGVKRLGERIVKSARDAALRDATNYRRNGTLHRQDRPVSMGINESA